MKAIIMAGGEGSRLRPLTCDCPKPMMRLMDKPVMQYALELLRAHGVTRIAATLGYLPDAVTDYFGDGADFGVDIRYFIEKTPLGTAGGVKQAVQMAKAYASFVRKIEVEVETLDMVREALEAGADIIMLDNMSVEDMKEAVRLCQGKAETECSGNVTRENIARLLDIGVDYISSGALTHSAPILDLSLKNLHAI